MAVGFSIVLMQFFRCVHPPAGANPLVVLLTGQSISIDWNYVFFPFGVGAIVLIIIALIVNNIFIKNGYPTY